MRRRRILIVWLLAIGICVRLYADSNPFRVITRVSPKKATVGQEITLGISVPKNVTLMPVSEQTDVRPFELKQVRAEGGQLFLTLTVFEVGKAVVPPLHLLYKDEAGKFGQISTEAVPVEIVSVGKRKSDKDDIRPIKGPARLARIPVRDFLFASLALALLVFLVVKIILRRRKAVFDPESLKPAHERVLLELGRLRAGPYWAERRYKEFFSEFSDILRRYLERRYQIEALELTTTELATLLKNKNFDTEIIKQVKNLLDQSDLVKFAKFEPTLELADQLERDLKQIVEKTRSVADEVQKS